MGEDCTRSKNQKLGIRGEAGTCGPKRGREKKGEIPPSNPNPKKKKHPAKTYSRGCDQKGIEGK